MATNYTLDQFWRLYEKLPQELKDAVSSEETGENIYNICKENKIMKILNQMIEYVGQVLIGALPPEEFQETLERELKLKKDVAKEVNREINRFIFYPVKTSLEELYKTEITPPAQMKTTSPPKERPPTPTGEDKYREAIE